VSLHTASFNSRNDRICSSFNSNVFALQRLVSSVNGYAISAKCGMKCQKNPNIPKILRTAFLVLADNNLFKASTLSGNKQISPEPTNCPNNFTRDLAKIHLDNRSVIIVDPNACSTLPK